MCLSRAAVLLLLGVAFLGGARAAYDNFPLKSVNVATADATDGAIAFYKTLGDGCLGGAVEDAHPVHGLEASDGGLVYLGKAVNKRGKSEAFVVKMSATGSCLWFWHSGLNNKEDAALQAVQLPGGGDLLVVGFRDVGGVYRRSITKLELATGREVWTATDWGDTSGSHGAFETVELDGDALLLAGLRRNPSKAEFYFKSYGNAPGGRAFVMKLPVSAAASSSPPSSSDADWSVDVRIPNGVKHFDSVKAVRALPSSGVAALLFAEGGDVYDNAVVALNSNGAIAWGPVPLWAVAGEGTDMVVANDGAALYVTGHGEPGTSARLTKLRANNGAVVWSRYYRSVPMEYSVGYLNECWGVQATADGGAILACGTGLEDCSAFSGQEKRDCKAGREVVGDLRPDAWPRRAGLWQSLIVRTDGDGNLLWQRVDQHREDGAPPMGSPEWEVGGRQYPSSASEHVTKTVDGGFAFVQDELAGVGVLRLAPGSGAGSPPSGPDPGPSPGPGEPEGRCCEDLVEFGFVYGRDSAVCAAAKWDGVACAMRVSFDDALSTCKSVGARLCSLSELKAKEANGVGCGRLKKKHVWTEEACERSRGHGHIVARAKDGRKKRCMRSDRRKKAAMLCCASSC